MPMTLRVTNIGSNTESQVREYSEKCRYGLKARGDILHWLSIGHIHKTGQEADDG